MITTSFPVGLLRQEFPALARAGDFIFLDNAARAQIPRVVLDAVTDHLVSRNVQRGGPYGRSRDVDAMIASARAAVADFVNANGPDEIAFGLNATSFIRSLSLAIGQTLHQRPEIVVSESEHEANVATWVALERAGARIVWWPVRGDGRIYPEDLDGLVNERTRLVACTVASNATGSITDVAAVAARAHRVGAEVFLDAVHYAPHGPVDVQAFGCDYMVCSGYKIFAPHMGFAWCRRASINRLPTFREDFIPDVTPDKLEAGTFVYENVAGMRAAVGYIESIGRRLGATGDRRAVVHSAMAAVAAYERTLSSALLDTLEASPGVTVYGVTDRARLSDRTPTVCFTMAGVEASEVSARLDARGIGARHGHMYSPRLLRRLGLLPHGVVRVSLVHYNTLDEIARFGDALRAR